MKPHSLAAFVIYRRSITFSFFIGTTLDHVRKRELSSDYIRAENTVTEFIRRAVEEFELTSAALEISSKHSETVVFRLAGHVRDVLRECAVSIRPVETLNLFRAFACPPLKTRQELRNVALRIWPVLKDHKSGTSALDSSTLGLYAQIQRLLDINLENN
jgi:hypothetical protein